MNVINDLRKKVKDKIVIKTVLGEETYCFTWNEPATISDIKKFEERNGCNLPDDYKDFLLSSNGAVIFKSENEGDGYKLLSLDEIENITQEMNEDGYNISAKCYCFMQCLFSDDVLLFDLNQNEVKIIDGDVGYPSAEWEVIDSNVNAFFSKLCQANGAMFWRW